MQHKFVSLEAYAEYRASKLQEKESKTRMRQQKRNQI